MVGAVKHIVGADLNHPATTAAHGLSQIGRRFRIQAGTEFLIVFSLVDGGVGRTVDDAVNPVVVDKLPDGSTVGNVQFLHIGIIPHMLGILFLQQLHLVSQLAVTARNQYVHYYSNSNGCCLSFK